MTRALLQPPVLSAPETVPVSRPETKVRRFSVEKVFSVKNCIVTHLCESSRTSKSAASCAKGNCHTHLIAVVRSPLEGISCWAWPSNTLFKNALGPAELS